MDPKEKFDGCMKQAEFLTQKFYNRQAYQWKITIGLWTALIASTGFLLDKDIHPSLGWVIGTELSFYVIYILVWVRVIAARNRNDQSRANHFRDEAEKLLFGSAHTVPPRYGFIDQYWAHIFEVVTTGIVILASILLLWPHCSGTSVTLPR